MLLPSIQSYLQSLETELKTIPEERRLQLWKIASFVKEKLEQGKTPELIYVCTHNSRRSHFGQLWGRVVAHYCGILVNAYSAGTEATAFHPNAIKAARNAGFIISDNGQEKNPTYSVLFDEKESPVICFSKTYTDASIPTSALCAIMTCTEADGNCPFIPGTELRVSLPYLDPKAFDGTAQQDEKYAERCRQIALENLFVFSLVKKS